MLPNVPGGFNSTLLKKYSFSIDRYCWVYKRWEKKEKKCHGEVAHNICIVDIGDLNWILNDTENVLFQNKYFMENDRLVMDCMEERIIAQNKLEYKRDCHTTAIGMTKSIQ